MIPIIEERHLALLKAIADLSTLFYPYQDEDGPVDSRLVFALGQIRGICSKAMSDFEKDRDDKAR